MKYELVAVMALKPGDMIRPDSLSAGVMYAELEACVGQLSEKVAQGASSEVVLDTVRSVRRTP